MDPTSSGRPRTAQLPRKARREVACDHCRAKKIRCKLASGGEVWSPHAHSYRSGNGSVPCSNCIDRDEQCTVSRRRRPRAYGSREPESSDLSGRVHHLETLLRPSTSGLRSQPGKRTSGLATTHIIDPTPGLNNRHIGSLRHGTAHAHDGMYPEDPESLNNVWIRAFPGPVLHFWNYVPA
jgi:hypothetical protein